MTDTNKKKSEDTEQDTSDNAEEAALVAPVEQPPAAVEGTLARSEGLAPLADPEPGVQYASCPQCTNLAPVTAELPNGVRCPRCGLQSLPEGA